MSLMGEYFSQSICWLATLHILLAFSAQFPLLFYCQKTAIFAMANGKVVCSCKKE